MQIRENILSFKKNQCFWIIFFKVSVDIIIISFLTHGTSHSQTIRSFSNLNPFWGLEKSLRFERFSITLFNKYFSSKFWYSPPNSSLKLLFPIKIAYLFMIIFAVLSLPGTQNRYMVEEQIISINLKFLFCTYIP